MLTRRLLAFVLVLGLAPGVTGGLVSFGGAHCSHACCRGQDFCERGKGDEHEADHAQAEASHLVSHAHEPAPSFVIAAIEPPSESCREICAMLRKGQTKTVGASYQRQFGAVHTGDRSSPTERFTVETSELETHASPRGPPREPPKHP